MSQKNIPEQLKEEIQQICGVDPDEIHSDTMFVEDIGFDPADEEQLKTRIEELYGIEYDIDTALPETFGELVKYVEENKKK